MCKVLKTQVERVEMRVEANGTVHGREPSGSQAAGQRCLRRRQENLFRSQVSWRDIAWRLREPQLEMARADALAILESTHVRELHR